MRKARENFSEVVNTVAIKGDRVILLSKNKPKAAIVSIKDLQLLEGRSIEKSKRLLQLEKFKLLRKKLAGKGFAGDSLAALRRMREERTEGFTDCN